MKHLDDLLALRRRRAGAVFVAVFVAIIFGIFSSANQGQWSGPNDVLSDSSEVANQGSELAIIALEELEVKGRAVRSGYSRAQFGVGWAVVDGCDVRNLILQRDLVDTVLGDNACIVLSGTLYDPYTGGEIEFLRGPDTSSLVHIDHVVALSDAWQKGAQLLSEETRVSFANDGLNLLAVDGRANIQKGDSDSATWLPSNKPYRCRFVARQIAVKVKYQLWVTSAEKSAMKRVLNSCPEQVLPVERSS